MNVNDKCEICAMFNLYTFYRIICMFQLILVPKMCTGNISLNLFYSPIVFYKYT